MEKKLTNMHTLIFKAIYKAVRPIYMGPVRNSSEPNRSGTAFLYMDRLKPFLTVPCKHLVLHWLFP